MKTTRLLALAALGLSLPAFAAAPLVIADFEGTNYGAWKVEGAAFGTAPARGTLPGQMTVDGFQGRGLANSFHGGDAATGRLTSPVFKVERKFITFLVGGGGFAGETCLNLLVDGKVVRSATGPNIVSGGREKLAPAAWEVSEFAGREARIEMVDARQDGWGHINVDHLAQTDDRADIALFVAPKPPAPPAPERTRRLTVSADFLQLPLMYGAGGARNKNAQRLNLEMDGKVARYLHAEFAAPEAKPNFIYSYDLREFRGREVTLRFKSADAGVLDRLQLTDTEVIAPGAYAGPHRPRFHFSPRLGWMNDINGSYYADGRWHVFYQFNPTDRNGGAGFDMHWGHSVSRDLVHWEEWPVALFPDASGQCYSGTAVMMRHHVPGLNDGANLPTPAMFVAATAPFSQHLTASTDSGRTWKRFAGNPVIKNLGDGDRDPKVVWHEASQHYVMVLYVGGPDTYRLLRSRDLVTWEQTSVLPNWYECPEFFPVKSAVTGEDLWLLYGCYRNQDPKKGEVLESNSCFQLGRFDGKEFQPIGKIRPAHQGPNFYGALVFINAPENRQVMMGWARGTSFPGEPFNQCASVPLEMKLRAIVGEDVLTFEPVKELQALRGKPWLELRDLPMAEANAQLLALALKKDAPLDVTVRFRAKGATPVRVTLRGHEFTLDASGRLALTRHGKSAGSTTLREKGATTARFLVDRGLVEAFWNGGESAHALASLHTDAGPALHFAGDATVEELIVYPMAGIWEK